MVAAEHGLLSRPAQHAATMNTAPNGTGAGRAGMHSGMNGEHAMQNMSAVSGALTLGIADACRPHVLRLSLYTFANQHVH